MKRTPLLARTAPVKRTPIKRSTTQVRKKRPGPARRGRIVDKPRLEWAATQPCQITGEFPATTHHVRFCGSPKDDTRIIRLVARLHMATHAGFRCCIEDGKQIFEETYECNIEDLISQLQARYKQEQGK